MMNERFLVCDDLIEIIDSIIDKEELEKIFPKSRNTKVSSGTFGKFNINEIPESLRNKIGI